MIKLNPMNELARSLEPEIGDEFPVESGSTQPFHDTFQEDYIASIAISLKRIADYLGSIDERQERKEKREANERDG
jgi:hypothetical protein